MSEIAIHAEQLGKQYQLGQRESYGTLREAIRRGLSAAHLRSMGGRGSHADGPRSFWALKNVSFEVESGQVLGIIGRNGAGKSTLLKILTRITKPTDGHAWLQGRAGSLLEVGTGFHPELTGRENVYLNGSILGMRKTEIDRRFDEIVDFSEVERFLDTPVKRYSSGMYVRLAFAVAAHLEPDILIVDEVLAVGDTAFQKKCLGKMGEAANSGKTVLLVSHNMAAIENLCSHALLLEQGNVVSDGPVANVIEAYLNLASFVASQKLASRPDRSGNGRLRLTKVEFLPSLFGVRTETVRSGDDLEICVSYEGEENLRNLSLSIGINTLSGQTLLLLGNELVGTEWKSVQSSGSIHCSLKRLPLAPGQYHLNLYCLTNGVLADWVQSAATLTVEAGDFFGTGKLPPASHGGLLVGQEWSLGEPR